MALASRVRCVHELVRSCCLGSVQAVILASVRGCDRNRKQSMLWVWVGSSDRRRLHWRDGFSWHAMLAPAPAATCAGHCCSTAGQGSALVCNSLAALACVALHGMTQVVCAGDCVCRWCVMRVEHQRSLHACAGVVCCACMLCVLCRSNVWTLRTAPPSTPM